MKRWWTSWYQPTEDHRPLTFPPNEAILGWWCTGQRSDDDAWTICALISAETAGHALEAAQIDWPEAELRFVGAREPDYVIQSDRFPLSDWMRERMVRG